MPRKISAICSLFLRRYGIISCQVTGARKYSEDLPQGGLEVPCRLTFEGSDGDISKVRSLVTNVDVLASTTANVIDADKESDQSMAKRRRTGDTVEEWVCIGKISLKNSDKMILLQGDELNDLHINACQLILAKQFPSLT